MADYLSWSVRCMRVISRFSCSSSWIRCCCSVGLDRRSIAACGVLQRQQRARHCQVSTKSLRHHILGSQLTCRCRGPDVHAGLLQIVHSLPLNRLSRK